VIIARKLAIPLINVISYMAILIGLEIEEERDIFLLQTGRHTALGLTVSSRKFHLIPNPLSYLD